MLIPFREIGFNIPLNPCPCVLIERGDCKRDPQISDNCGRSSPLIPIGRKQVWRFLGPSEQGRFGLGDLGPCGFTKQGELG